MLHTLSHSPWQVDLPALLRLISPGDALLLTQDGVIAALAGSEHSRQLLACHVPLYALESDLLARGIASLCDPAITIIDYGKFVELSEQHMQQILW
ncbi:MAG: sulfurtransferase complex subunit TusB [Enterobacteriaceae bacterium]